MVIVEGLLVNGPVEWYENLENQFSVHNGTWIAQNKELKPEYRKIFNRLIVEYGFFTVLGYVQRPLKKVVYRFEIDRYSTEDKLTHQPDESAPIFSLYDVVQGKCAPTEYAYQTWLHVSKITRIPEMSLSALTNLNGMKPIKSVRGQPHYYITIPEEFQVANVDYTVAASLESQGAVGGDYADARWSGKMSVVTELDQITENIAELERGRSVSDDAYLALIKRGTCFVPYVSTEGLSFAPSRFVGYVRNKLSTHAENPDRDGRITNTALNKLFGFQPQRDEFLERQYLAFCERMGVQPSKTGAFGVARKYWVTLETIDILEKDITEEIAQDPNITATEKQQLIKARIGQGQFREHLLSYWGKCSLTGCEFQGVLRASHIKPWRVCTNQERLDVFNGLLLSPNMDALFDKGLISFEKTGKILLSSQLTKGDIKTLGCNQDMRILMRPEHEKYMAYHRMHQFLE